ncbi:MAG: hypothetical protein HKN23_08815, partial [Verrucomicrobiales bacterium]|nr:hypothetical protein [Verrucomicrobiales bacterium]
MLPPLAKLVWEPAIPPFFIILIGVVLGFFALAVYAGKSGGGRLATGRRMTLLAMRIVAILLICLFLAQPMIEESFPRRHPQRVALVVIDSSQSMLETDGIDQASRIDTARKLLAESGLYDLQNDVQIGDVRMFSFSEDASPLAKGGLLILNADGETTQFHSSLSSVLGTVKPLEHCVGLFLFSDGHDFELAPTTRTTQLARAKQTPIFPVPIGREQTVPDVSVNIASYQPYTFVRQVATIQASVRISGTADPRPIRVELMREGEVLRERRVNPAGSGEATVAFEVSEEEPGQFEYEIRATAFPGERELGNNSAYTFLNVTNAKIQVLLIEGAPHWDTTFMRRTLAGNERIELTSVISLGKGKPMVTTTATEGPDGQPPRPTVPETEEDFTRFRLIVLGREVDDVLS